MPVYNNEGSWVGDTTMIDTQVNAPVTVTLPAPVDRMRWLITGLTITTDRIPTTVGSVTITSNSVALERIEANNAWPLDVIGDSHYRGEPGSSVVITAPAFGASVRCTIRVQAMKVTA